MSTPQRTRITDPERIRALAHPLRIQLLDHLGGVDDATATQCAEATGESVASCSFHLRMLAKYGYIEPAERRGREKPWKLIREIRDYQPDHEVPGSLTAATELADHLVIHEAERIRRFLGKARHEETDWLDAITISRSDMWLTLDEMEEMSRQLQAIAVQHIERSRNPEARPEGARRVNLFTVLNPDPRS